MYPIFINSLGNFNAFLVQSMIGPGFRIYLTEKSILNGSICFLGCSYNSIGKFTLGFGTELGYKFNFNKLFYLNTGIDLTNDFIFSNKENNLILFSLQPFINVGWNLTGNK